MRVSFSVNGHREQIDVEPRRTLADALREDLGLTGTHLGCEHGVCGACTILLDGAAVRSCLLLAVPARRRAPLNRAGVGKRERPHPLPGTVCGAHRLPRGFFTPRV